ncbi:MAG: metalloregulator ArsR/SmtB family transcription factor [candidate division WOR-3 bacterium]
MLVCANMHIIGKLMELVLDQLLNILKALADRTRFRIFWVLRRANCEMCVCELMTVLKENQYNISRHLKTLKLSGLVIENRRGRFVYYSVSKLGAKAYEHLLQMVSAISDDKLSKDAAALLALLKEKSLKSKRRHHGNKNLRNRLSSLSGTRKEDN